MRCPACQHDESRVIDSRTIRDAIRRRRSCQACGHRFSTLERVELKLPWIVKKQGGREPFQRDKVLHGIALACRKRPVDAEQLDEAVRQVEQRLIGLRKNEVSAEAVGRIVMDVLREVDEVAYVRFASVYQEFESVEKFAEIVLPFEKTSS
ncbi:MAG: transcriptional regulator NrdR [Myxococcota bacterium]